MSVRNGVTVRGVSNGNERGSAETRRRRKVWLLETYAADQKGLRVIYSSDPDKGGPTYWLGLEVDLFPLMAAFGSVRRMYEDLPYIETVEVLATARCFRCGEVLTFETLTVDRIIPGCKGGTYRRNNIRPACAGCNSETGGPLAKAKIKKVKGRRGHRVLEAAT